MRSSKAATGFIFITVLIDVIGLGIIIPVLPTLITELTGGSISDASIYGGWLMFAYAFMQFLFAPILGGISDKVGRRPVLLFSLFGFALDYLLMALAPTIFWLFIGRILSGIAGASYTTASAYIADTSAPEDRAKNFGMLGAAFGLGFIVGPVLGGILGEYGSRIPFYAAGAITLVNWLYGFFVLPESLAQENRRSYSWKRANPIGTLLQLKRYPIVVGLVLPLIFLYTAAHATQSTWAYFTVEKFDWSEKDVGYSLGFVGLLIALVQGVIIGPTVKKIGQLQAVYIGLAFNALGFVLIALATEGWMIYALLVPYALGGLAGPSLQGIMSNSVPSNEQGELQGGLTSLISVTSIFGPLLMTSIFGYFTDVDNPYYVPSAPFYLGAVLAILSVIFAYRTLSKT
ncbi:MAG: TCR/Tet family MFS transporter [Cyclobacteriaceae bacterium]